MRIRGVFRLGGIQCSREVRVRNQEKYMVFPVGDSGVCGGVCGCIRGGWGVGGWGGGGVGGGWWVGGWVGGGGWKSSGRGLIYRVSYMGMEVADVDDRVTEQLE